MRMFPSFDATDAIDSSTDRGSEPIRTRSSAVRNFLPKRRTVIATSGVDGGYATATREPSSRRASTIGDSRRSKPNGRVICIAAASSALAVNVSDTPTTRSSLPDRSTYREPGPLIMISVTESSATSGPSSGR